MFEVKPGVAGAPGADPDDVRAEQHGLSDSLEPAEEFFLHHSRKDLKKAAFLQDPVLIPA